MRIGFHFSAIPTLLNLLTPEQFPALFVNLNSTAWVAYNSESRPSDNVYRTGYCVPNTNGAWPIIEKDTHWCQPQATEIEKL
jgi:hypothetical protein